MLLYGHNAVTQSSLWSWQDRDTSRFASCARICNAAVGSPDSVAAGRLCGICCAKQAASAALLQGSKRSSPCRRATEAPNTAATPPGLEAPQIMVCKRMCDSSTQHACWHAELLFDSTVGAHVALAPPLVAPVMHRHAPNPVALAHHHAVLTRLWTWCLQKQRQLDTASAGSASAGGATRRLPLELAVLHRRCKGAKCARVVRPPSCTPLKRIDAPCVPCVGSTA